MKNYLFFIFTITISLTAKSQIYTPQGTIQGTSSNNNIGIGTTNPLVKLDVNSTGVAALFTSTTNSVPVSIINGGTPMSTIGFKGSTSLTDYNVRVGADGNDLIFYTSNIEQIKINSNGNVGIGTVAPK